MADFLTAYRLTSKAEGGYANDPDDKGGETYKGIARNFFPGWPGWPIIDAIKLNVYGSNAIDFEAKKNQALEGKVQAFFKTSFWDANTLDGLNDQSIANEMYDTGVNMGVRIAGKFLQVALNVLNLNGKRYPELVEDGKVGARTVLTFNSLSDTDKKYVLALLNAQQGSRYIEICKNNPKQEKFMRSWASRLV